MLLKHGYRIIMFCCIEPRSVCHVIVGWECLVYLPRAAGRQPDLPARLIARRTYCKLPTHATASSTVTTQWAYYDTTGKDCGILWWTGRTLWRRWGSWNPRCRQAPAGRSAKFKEHCGSRGIDLADEYLNLLKHDPEKFERIMLSNRSHGHGGDNWLVQKNLNTPEYISNLCHWNSN